MQLLKCLLCSQVEKIACMQEIQTGFADHIVQVQCGQIMKNNIDNNNNNGSVNNNKNNNNNKGKHSDAVGSFSTSQLQGLWVNPCSPHGCGVLRFPLTAQKPRCNGYLTRP